MMRWLLGLLTFNAILVAGCTRGPSHEDHGDEHAPGVGEEHTENIELSPEAEDIAGIQTRLAAKLALQEEFRVPGLVVPASQGRAVVTPPVGGQILAIYVKPGDSVTAGQAVAKIGSSELAEAASQITEAERSVIAALGEEQAASGEVGLARGKLQTAREVLARQKAFAKAGAFSQPSLQASQKELADAEAELDRGKQDQAVHQAQLERAERLCGQELISRTELEEARLEVATDKIRQRNAERRIELVRAAYERERRIAELGLTNSREIQAAESELRSAELEVKQALIRLSTAKSALAAARKGVEAARSAYHALAGTGNASGGSLVVKAPIGGVVVDVSATLGQAVERATELCEVENLGMVWVIAQVSDKNVRLAKVGNAAEVSVSSYPTRKFAGVVQSVGSRMDPKTRALPVRVAVPNAQGTLKNGMVADVALGIGNRTAALAVPRAAVVEDGSARKLYVALGQGRYEERAVEVGRTSGHLVEIVSGLQVGERVVTRGAFVLKSEKVKAELKGHEH